MKIPDGELSVPQGAGSPSGRLRESRSCLCLRAYEDGVAIDSTAIYVGDVAS